MNKGVLFSKLYRATHKPEPAGDPEKITVRNRQLQTDSRFDRIDLVGGCTMQYMFNRIPFSAIDHIDEQWELVT